MSDNERSLFFADSDDEQMADAVEISTNETIPEVTLHPSPSTPPAAGQSSTSALFFPGSDDEEEMQVSSPIGLHTVARSLEEDITDVADVDVPQPEHDRAGSVSTTSSSGHVPRDSSPASSVDAEHVTVPPKKKRKLSPRATIDKVQFTSSYLGSFLVGNAWSTVHGKGYVKVRCCVLCARPYVSRLMKWCSYYSLVTKFALSAMTRKRFLVRKLVRARHPIRKTRREKAARNNFQ